MTEDEVDIDSVQVDELLLFPLKKGDEFTYYPSADFFECPLNGSNLDSGNLVSTKIGSIFYTESTAIDLSDAHVIYHFGKRQADVSFFPVLIIILILLAGILLILVLELTIGNRYRVIQQAADEKAERELGAALREAEQANKAKTVIRDKYCESRTFFEGIVKFS